MIVDQLRCGGVLEAVRVSRAGYPTRYPHEVFKARYYILGDSKDKTPVSPYGNKKKYSMSAEDVEVKRLVSKIAFDIWEADHEAMIMALEDEARTPVKVGCAVSLISKYCFLRSPHHLVFIQHFAQLSLFYFLPSSKRVNHVKVTPATSMGT